MPLINLDAVLNPLPELKDHILDYIPRATTSEFGIVALGSGINVDSFGRIYLDTQEYSDRLAAIEATAASTLETTVNTLEDKADELAASITQKLGTPNGIATLDSAGSIPSTQLPSYVDDVLEYENVAAFPATGETGKIYVETTGNTTYRWSGATYVKITAGEVSSVAGKKGIVTLTKDDVGLSNVDNTNDLNKPLSTATQTALTALENKAKRGIINLYDASLIYGLNERVVLTNGDIVKSTTDGNAHDPNVNMTGWVNPEVEQLIFNETILGRVGKLENYIVYAEKYGSSLNEAITAINLEFIGKRVRVYVPSNFPVTAAVNLDIDCDLSMTSLQVMNDVDVIFKPATGWNGTSTECDVFCNNKSIRLGWDLLDDLGYITINKTTFYDVGNESLNTSASYFTAFLINNHNIKKLDLFNPATINSYVKPNGSEGDNAGSNRSVEIGGFLNIGDFASDINIFYPYAKNLKTGEDSDGLVINCGQGTQVSPVFNIDIHGGKFIEMGKRAVKIIGTDKNASGIRFHGDMYATGSGSFPWAGVEISGYVAVEWNGTAKMKGFIQDFNIWGGAYVTGDVHFICEKSEALNIASNSTRGLVCDQGSTPAARKCIIDIAGLTVLKGYEHIRIRDGQTVKIGKVKSEIIQRLATVEVSHLTIGELNIDFVNASTVTSITSNIAYFTGATPLKIGRITGNLVQTVAPVNYLFFLSGSTGFNVDHTDIKGNISAAPFYLLNSSNVKIRDSKSDGKYLVGASGGSNLLLSQCKSGWGGLLENNATTPITNVVELNTVTF